MELTKQQVIAMKRKRGELDLSVARLAKITGISRWTLDDILKRGHKSVNSITFKRINDWLIDEYTKNS